MPTKTPPLDRAIKKHLATPGAQQPAADLSGIETAGPGRQYVVLRNTGGILAVFRLDALGALKQLKRWPKELDHA